MDTNAPIRIQRWESLRKKGKKNFIIINGVLFWGMPMFLLMSFVVNKLHNSDNPPVAIALSALLWGVGGLAFGWIVWNMSEKKYQEYLAKTAERKQSEGEQT